MLTGPDELRRLNGHGDEAAMPAPGLTETLMIRGDRPEQVIGRARIVLTAVIEGFAAGLTPRDPEWSERLPPWFVSACAPEQSEAERAAWLERWRALDRAGRARAEAELGWSLVDWLYAVDYDVRPWRWWDVDDLRVVVIVDGWPAPLDSLTRLLIASGANEVVPLTHQVDGSTPGLDAIAVRLQEDFEEPLAQAGVTFRLRTVRRLGPRGTRRLLLLHVWPKDGFDNFEWANTEKTWLGRTTTLMSPTEIKLAAEGVLRRYMDGETPPFD